MTEIRPNDVLLRRLDIADFLRWLPKNGWQKKEHPNKKLLVFEGRRDDEGKPILLALPARMDFEDTYLRLSEAVNLLAVVHNQSPENIIREINPMGRLVAAVTDRFVLLTAGIVLFTAVEFIRRRGWINEPLWILPPLLQVLAIWIMVKGMIAGLFVSKRH